MRHAPHRGPRCPSCGTSPGRHWRDGGVSWRCSGCGFTSAPRATPNDNSTDPHALAQDMAAQGFTRAQFILAVDAAAEEMAHTARRGPVALAAVFRAIRAYRAAALEAFDRIHEETRR